MDCYLVSVKNTVINQLNIFDISETSCNKAWANPGIALLAREAEYSTK